MVLVGIFFSSCVALKPYEKIYVNDPEMQMTSDASLQFQGYIFTIREASISSGTSKSSGGCGCN